MKLLYKFNFVKFQDSEKPKYPDGGTSNGGTSGILF